MFNANILKALRQGLEVVLTISTVIMTALDLLPKPPRKLRKPH
jgi:hypothetical protein